MFVGPAWLETGRKSLEGSRGTVAAFSALNRKWAHTGHSLGTGPSGDSGTLDNSGGPDD